MINLKDNKVFSQNGEDGIIEHIFDTIGTTNKFFLEFGTGPGAVECNTRHLRENKEWKGVMWDLGATPDNENIGLFKEKIELENVHGLFEKYNISENLDFMSIDIDYNDWHIWKKIGEKYKPRVVCIEYNFQYSPYDDVVAPYDPEGGPMGREGKLTSCAQGSILAYYKLAKYLGYSLICSDAKGINLFFIRNDCNPKIEDFPMMNDLFTIYDLTFHLRLSTYDIIGYPNIKKNVKYLSAQEILNLEDEDFSDCKHEYLRWYIPMRVYDDGRLQCPIGLQLNPSGLGLGSHSKI